MAVGVREPREVVLNYFLVIMVVENVRRDVRSEVIAVEVKFFKVGEVREVGRGVARLLLRKRTLRYFEKFPISVWRAPSRRLLATSKPVSDVNLLISDGKSPLISL